MRKQERRALHLGTEVTEQDRDGLLTADAELSLRRVGKEEPLLVDFSAVEKFCEASPAGFRKKIIAPFVVLDAPKSTIEIAFDPGVLPIERPRPPMGFRTTGFHLARLSTLVNKQLNEGEEGGSVMYGLKSLEQGVGCHTLFWPGSSFLPYVAYTL
ncbi:hypothetical protein [Deinococcus hopiensis]|uniref:hypothetical protein n=1 Tax=Deinococcus hopiensis TaxID=309885 RepID=UPI001483C55A|nr:hypothetical protein [Deinococcus hopiensis]